MKSILTVLILSMLVSCSDDAEFITVVEEPKREFFQGYFNLQGPNGAINCIRLEEVDSKVTLDSDCFSLVTKNPKNGTLGQFPRFSIKDKIVINEELRIVLDVNYNSGHDIEEDSSGANITGTRRTDLLFRFIEGKLRLNIKVYANKNNNNLNFIVAKRSFKEL